MANPKAVPLGKRYYEREGVTYVETGVDSYNKLRRVASVKELVGVRPDKALRELPTEEQKPSPAKADKESPPKEEKKETPKQAPKAVGRPRKDPPGPSIPD
jgi:hypothetical protein